MAGQDYTKLKNAELEALLKQRSLQTGGKKADMVARLQAADAEAPTTAATLIPDASKPAAPVAAESKAEAAAPAPAPTPAAATEPSTTATTDAAADDSAKPAEEKKLTREERDAERAAKRAEDEKKFGQGMSATDIDAEIARRKKRAEKFGIPVSTEAEESIKALERAKKFGTAASGSGDAPADSQTKTVEGLDSALPERQRKRGREDGGGGRGGKKQRGGGPDKGGNRASGGAAQAPKQNGNSSRLSEADRAKAEARKAKWATPSS